MIATAVALLAASIVALVAGAALGDDGLVLVWVAAVGAPLALVPLWVGLRRMLPRRSRFVRRH